MRKNYSTWISNEILQRLLLKIGNSYRFVSCYSLYLLIQTGRKIMSILGRDIPSQRKSSTLLKRTVKMVMLSFWLPNHIEYACKAWFNRKKKIDHNIFRSIFEQYTPMDFRYMLVHSKKICSKTPPLN